MPVLLAAVSKAEWCSRALFRHQKLRRLQRCVRRCRARTRTDEETLMPPFFNTYLEMMVWWLNQLYGSAPAQLTDEERKVVPFKRKAQ